MKNISLGEEHSAKRLMSSDSCPQTISQFQFLVPSISFLALEPLGGDEKLATVVPVSWPVSVRQGGPHSLFCGLLNCTDDKG